MENSSRGVTSCDGSGRGEAELPDSGDFGRMLEPLYLGFIRAIGVLEVKLPYFCFLDAAVSRLFIVREMSIPEVILREKTGPVNNRKDGMHIGKE